MFHLGVEKSAYRQPVTPQGLKAIEKGTLTWLDDDMYNNLNTGVLEQYLEEKNLEESFEVSHWSTPKVFYGIAIGAVFSGVTAYIGLKLGLAISAAWYIAYLLGMALKWSPSEVNIATSATTGATHASTGFIFTFPAIFLLASDPKYFLADGPLITNADTFNLAFVGIVASMFAGFLGIMYFIIFRRVWLVEDPLPLPGFEATLKMLDIASDVNTGAVEHARDSLKTIGWWTTITMGGLFLVEYPLVWANGKKWALLDFLAEKGHIGEYGLATFYSKGKIHQPSGIDEATGESLNYTQWSEGTAWNPFAYTYIGVALTPSMFAIGWFMKTRVAFLVNLGTLVGWFFLVPAVVYFNFPIYDASLQASIPIQDYADGGSASLQMIAFSKSVRTIAIGSIVGGGMFGLAKMWKTFVNIFADIGSAFKGEGSQEYMEGKGWYEWPLKHIPIFMGITFFAMILIFTIGGFSILASLVFATVLILTTFLLGAIAVRVMGETGIEPVSGTSFIVLLMLLGVFLNAQDLLQLNTQDAVLLGLVGTTVFGSAISMSGTVIGDYKNSLYIGNRPYHISKGNIMGVIPGAIIGAGVAIFLSKQLADGTIDLMAPQANAFATFSVIFAEREGDLVLLALGFLLGMFVEWGTGMGTSFGLGMYLDVPHTLPMLIGGYSRDKWEEKRLTPKIEAIKEKDGATAAEKQRALILLSTFMVAAGLLTGEAFFGTESSILSFIDSLWIATPENETGTFFGIEEFSSSVQWYIGRMVGFIGLNVAIGGGIYYLFKRAGVIGGESVDAVLEN
ncbi:OPT/YSL family transporter [Euryarchaeota archaeon]|nr:OPT/YSL family transporter [Euryarchaeota archaeon]